MPELPEVEVVRRGLQQWVSGRTIANVDVRHPRAVRRHEAGADDFVRRLAGHRFRCASRRGKYLWLPLAGEDTAVVAHLGMSGQLVLLPSDAPDGPHLRVRMTFDDGGRELRFVDQRTFGGLALAELVPDEAAGHLPAPVRHIARDPLDPAFDDDEFVGRVRARESALKRILLDQTVASGIGNIYADEALWRTRLHGSRVGRTLTRPQVRALLASVREVMGEALEQGGTSFDSLYVNVNGESGYFERSLHAYGREGEPCDRCGTPIRRVAFMNRSSYFCPRCQRGARGKPSARR